MAQVEDVAVPDIGDFTDVAVVEVHVAPGQQVALDDPLITLETDKATMDVPAPFGGVVEEVLLKVGDVASQGTVVARVRAEAGAGAPAEETLPPEASGTAALGGPAESAVPERAGAPSESSSQSAIRSAVRAEASAGGGGFGPDLLPDPPPPKAPEHAADGSANGGPVYASPSVRRLARELGVDLQQVQGSGRKGRIVPEDVRTFAEGGGAVATPDGAAARVGAGAATGAGIGLDLPPWPQVDFAKFGEVERAPLSRIRKLSKNNLARNWVHIPHVTHHDEADVTELEAFRKQLNAEQSDVKVTMVALLLKACAATLKAFPDFNSSLDGDELVLKKYYHLGFAADTPNGLVVPVVRDVDQKGLLQLAGELTELSGKARAGKLGPADMSGGTFTISSLGGIGGTAFTPIVNAPEVAILGVVRSQTKPVWDGQQFVPRLMLPLSLSYDHRVIDGASAARFVAHLAGVLTDLRRVLL